MSYATIGFGKIGRGCLLAHSRKATQEPCQGCGRPREVAHLSTWSTNMVDKVIWPEQYDPRTSASYALNDIDVKALPEVVWKLLVAAR